MSDENLLDIDKLRNAYEATIIPLINLAKNQGFSTEWHLSNRIIISKNMTQNSQFK